jgi:3-phosphoshikimate 1-carboxyvinyltransferase
MISYRVFPPKNNILQGTIQLPGSKSHTNRLLAMQLMRGIGFCIEGISESTDSRVMQLAMELPESHITDVGDAGTAMRFLTACYSILPGHRIITGSSRMKQRPIKPLVDALQQLGADIKYVGETGFPPLEIRGNPMAGGIVTIDSEISSQFISALMLVAPFTDKGITIYCKGRTVSAPYIEMTAETLKTVGANVTLSFPEIQIGPGIQPPEKLCIEKDWSAAGFWLEAAALSDECNLLLKDLSADSIQGDRKAIDLWSELGVTISCESDGIRLHRNITKDSQSLDSIDFTQFPDLSLPYAATIAGMNRSTRLTGLHNLNLKESRRIETLESELKKTGVDVKAGTDILSINKTSVLNTAPEFDTHSDHRLTMSLAMLCLKTGSCIIHDAKNCEKSYPDFWQNMKTAGFVIEPV